MRQPHQQGDGEESRNRTQHLAEHRRKALVLLAARARRSPACRRHVGESTGGGGEGQPAHLLSAHGVRGTGARRQRGGCLFVTLVVLVGARGGRLG